jgi:hypothetical protein
LSLKTAYVHLREDPHYRHDAFIQGLRRLGYHIELGEPYGPLTKDQVVVIWNKTSRSDRTIEMARKGEGAVIVAENGYYGKDKQGRTPFALALDGHCGSGRWYVGDDTRFKALGIEFKDWRPTTSSRKVLIADQRGIGSPRMASPPNFGANMAAALTGQGWRPQVRPHPGDKKVIGDLLTDLEGAMALVVWSSNCATTALIEGIPTFYCAPTMITAGAAQRYAPSRLRELVRPDRTEAFVRMSWAQAFVEEIESGEALQRLLDVHAGDLPACQEGFGL